MNKWVEYTILAAVTFTIPTLVVASKWGAQEQMFKQLLENNNEIKENVLKIDDKLNDTRERVIRVEAYIDNQR